MSGSGLTVAIMILGVTACVAQAAEPAGLVARWDFDEGQGDTLRDTSGNGHHGKIHGAKWTKSGDGFALEFDKTDDHVDCGDSPALNLTGPLSVEAWVKPVTVGWDGGGLIGTSAQGYLLTYRTGIGPSQAERGLCQWNIGGEHVVRAKLKLGQWNHVVGTFDGKTMELWINGRRKASGESPGPKTTGDFSICSAKPVPSYARLDQLADQAFGASADRPSRFQGSLDQVRLYDRALAESEICANFKTQAPTYGFDPDWFHVVQTTPFYYFDQGHLVVELDYRGLQPLAGEGRIAVALSRQGGTAIATRTIDPLPDSGLVEAELPCENLVPGTYVISVVFDDGKGARPAERITFAYPPKPVLPSPAERTVGSLPPSPAQVPFDLKVGAGGGFDLIVNGVAYPFESRISWPHGDFNRMSVADAQEQGEESWNVEISEVAANQYLVKAEGSFYTIDRHIEVLPTHIHVKDKYTNTTSEDLGLLIYNEMPVQKDRVNAWRLGGYEGRRRMSLIHQRGNGGLSLFVKHDTNVGIGVVPMDDVYVAQGVLYAEDDRIGMGTERFALAPNSSYHLEWKVYPTGSGDYYDFINTFRKVEGRIGTVHGALGFISYNPRHRRQIPTKDFIDKQGLQTGILHCLSFTADDPGISIEGIEFMDFPKEMEMVKRQIAAIKKRHPGFGVVFHVIHTLYATNEPDRYPDAKVIRANGEHASMGGGAYFSDERRKDGWAWYYYYPTPGNSFHDAMMKSIDVMMDDMGATGAFMDGFNLAYLGRWTYDGRWDGHSAEIDLESKTIKRKMGSVLLLSQPTLIEFARRIRDKGGLVIANGANITPSIAKETYIAFDAEHLSGPECHLAPTVLALGGGGTEKGVYLNILEKLSWGVLFMPYHVPRAVGRDLTHPLMSSKQFPITFEEIRSGMVKGKERIVTMNSGAQGWGRDRRLHLVHKFDGRGAPSAHDFVSTFDADGVRTQLDFAEHESAVIEPIPVTLQASSPVNVRVVQYDDAAFKFLLNGQGETTLEAFVGESYFPGGRNYRVTINDRTTTITAKEATLQVPLHLEGQTEVEIFEIREPL